MDIFKLFFDHDLRLDQLAKRNANKTQEETEASIEDFMRPIPTYSKFYITGTRLDGEMFGINVLAHFDRIMEQMSDVFSGYNFIREYGPADSFKQAVQTAEIGEAIVITKSENHGVDPATLRVDSESNVGHFKEELSDVLLSGHLVLYKEHAHNGFDLHLFSKKNIYESLFYAFKELISDSFRFFSINSKRMRTEQHFYFETWTLDRPPHGAEEVFPETVL